MKDKDQETLKKIKLERLIKTRGSKNRGARYERINDGELYEIWKYIQHHGNPYPNAHELNIVKETAKKFNI